MYTKSTQSIPLATIMVAGIRRSPPRGHAPGFGLGKRLDESEMFGNAPCEALSYGQGPVRRAEA
jgi:hypothetical protein